MGFAIPTYEVHVKPNYYSSADNPASNYRVVWTKHASPTTYPAPSNNGRMLQTPNSPRADLGPSGWEWWLAFEVKIDPSWDASKQGWWGTGAPANLHNTPNDVGNVNGSGALGWGWGEGTSSVQTSYVSNNWRVWAFANRPNDVLLIDDLMTKGDWHSFLVKLTLGRSDGSVSASGHPNGGNGRVLVWEDGSDTEYDSGNINTLQRAQHPVTGDWYVQTQMLVWEGFYTANSDAELILSHTAVRVGRTMAECLADSQITKVSDVVADIYDGSGTNLGPSYYTVLTSRQSTDFLLPAELGGAPANSFGKSTVGGTKGSLTANVKRVAKYTADANRDVAEVWAWLRGDGSVASQVIKAVIYADSAGEPGALLGTSAEVTFSAETTAGAFVQFTFATPVVVVSGTAYWLGLISGATSAVTEIAWDAAGAFRSLADTYTGGAADPFGGGATSGAREFSFYAVGPVSGRFVPIAVDASASLTATLTVSGIMMEALIAPAATLTALITVTSGGATFAGNVTWVPTTSYVAAKRGEFREVLADNVLGAVVEWNETTDRWDYV